MCGFDGFGLAVTYVRALLRLFRRIVRDNFWVCVNGASHCVAMTTVFVSGCFRCCFFGTEHRGN